MKPDGARSGVSPRATGAASFHVKEAASAVLPVEKSLFCCPLCGQALARQGGALRCEAGHSFDAAREGYVHLLPASRMRAKTPGDSKEMVRARHSFLGAGYYAPFAEALETLLRQTCPMAAPVVLDAGCGEGYYTRAARAALPEARLAAFDISKYAVQAAARAGGAEYAVAGSFAIPVASGTVDAVLNIFSPAAAEEFARVLRPGGTLLYAVPGARHLFGLKQLLYDTPYENSVRDIAYPGFRCVSRTPVRGEITVTGAQVQNLFAMTPYYWKTPRDGAQKLADCAALTTEIAFDYLCYVREG